jgi:ADP-ribose pyrophosphatase YjhB (NUDIX family)
VNRPVVGVGAVARRGDDLLMVRRGHGPAAGRWSIPGGHVEAGETLHEALVREVHEETGLEVVVDRFLGWAEHIGDDPEPFHIVILDFEVTPLDPRQPLRAGDDAAEAVWVPVHEVGDLNLVGGLYEFLAEVGVL